MDLGKIAAELVNPRQKTAGDKLERANVLFSLAKNGFSIEEICTELRDLYDDSETDATLKKQILDMIIKVHGLYTQEEKKETPRIVFNIVAKENRLNEMLCPNLGGEAA